MSRALSVVRNRAVLLLLRVLRRRDWLHIGDFGYRFVAPWEQDPEERIVVHLDWDPTPSEIVAMRGWR
jgi:hypothetical protein